MRSCASVTCTRLAADSGDALCPPSRPRTARRAGAALRRRACSSARCASRRAWVGRVSSACGAPSPTWNQLRVGSERQPQARALREPGLEHGGRRARVVRHRHERRARAIARAPRAAARAPRRGRRRRAPGTPRYSASTRAAIASSRPASSAALRSSCARAPVALAELRQHARRAARGTAPRSARRRRSRAARGALVVARGCPRGCRRGARARPGSRAPRLRRADRRARAGSRSRACSRGARG